MNNQPIQRPPEMSDEDLQKWEIAVQDRARQFAYPPTPDIAGLVRARLKSRARVGIQRGLRLALTVLLALMIATLAVPQTRAFVLDILRIGAVRIIFGAPSLTPTITPAGTPTSPPLKYSGETTLADAARQLGKPILLPSYPAELGAPDHVFAEDFGGIVVTLVWMKPDDPAQINLALEILDNSAVGTKLYPGENSNEITTRVSGRSAVWLTNIHDIYFFKGNEQITRTVDKNVLVWTVAALTYRLETHASLDEAVRIAESLR
ncbi:MAG: hypothetical protein ABI690_26470 [Chloroflexota bacterium]